MSSKEWIIRKSHLNFDIFCTDILFCIEQQQVFFQGRWYQAGKRVEVLTTEYREDSKSVELLHQSSRIRHPTIQRKGDKGRMLDENSAHPRPRISRSDRSRGVRLDVNWSDSMHDDGAFTNDEYDINHLHQRWGHPSMPAWSRSHSNHRRQDPKSENSATSAE